MNFSHCIEFERKCKQIHQASVHLKAKILLYLCTKTEQNEDTTH